MFLTGEALVASEVAMAEGRLFWRVSDGAGRACNGGDGVVLPASQGVPGPWTSPVPYPVICESGWHATTDPIRWAGSRLALVEVDRVSGRQGDKVVCSQLRELAVVDECVDVGLWVAAHRPNLCRADLRGACLYGASLHGANLHGANLYEADLRGANLKGANLQGDDLSGANLRGASLKGANLQGADLCGADLYGADLCGSDLRGADLHGANLQGANLYGADLRGANLKGANLHGTYLEGSMGTEASHEG